MASLRGRQRAKGNALQVRGTGYKVQGFGRIAPRTSHLEPRTSHLEPPSCHQPTTTLVYCATKGESLRQTRRSPVHKAGRRKMGVLGSSVLALSHSRRGAEGGHRAQLEVGQPRAALVRSFAFLQMGRNLSCYPDSYLSRKSRTRLSGTDSRAHCDTISPFGARSVLYCLLPGSHD